MKKLFTKLVITLGLAVAVTAQAQIGGTPTFHFIPLLSGYNVSIPTNVIVGPALLAVNGGATVVATNVLYTKYNGQIVYSYSNNVNGGLGTNSLIGDAFQVARLSADVNGDINANASLWVFIGNTNLLPIVATNSQGQFFIPTVTTNGAFPFNGGPNPVLWPLGVNSGPNWLALGSTNFYSQFGVNNITNQLFVNLYGAPSLTLNGTGPGLSPQGYTWETTPIFTWAVSSGLGSGNTIFIAHTNLPTSFLQGYAAVVMTIGFTNSTYTVGTNGGTLLLNQAGILQPQP